MKIAMLSSAAAGGAGIAAQRLCVALNQLDDLCCHFIDISLLGELPSSVVYKGSASNKSISDTHFTGEHVGFVRQWVIDLLMPYDVINVQWASFLVTTTEIMALAVVGKQIVITMHDYYYSTGGCHYQAGCDKQRNGCAICPQVNDALFSRLATAKAFDEKRRLLDRANVRITAPSKHLISGVLGAGLSNPARAYTVRNAFSPMPLQSLDAETTLSKSPDAVARRILIIADSLGERRKGVNTAIEAARKAASMRPDYFELHVVGGTSPELIDLAGQDMPIVFHGHISAIETISAIYSRCALLLTCSTEDNWPNVLVEACSFGMLPIVGPGHGCEEFVREYALGFVASDYHSDSFAGQIMLAAPAFSSPHSGIADSRNRLVADHSPLSVAEQFRSVLIAK